MFEEIIGQPRLVEALKGSIQKNQISHAYLFIGPRGIGKEALARAFVAGILCQSPMDERPCGHCPACLELKRGHLKDFIRVAPEEGQRTIKIRQIRDLIAGVASKTYDGAMRVILISQAEAMTPEAQNALLKSLEEPEPGNVFIITAENREKILPTIRSRCQTMTLEPLPEEGIRRLLTLRGYAAQGTQTDRLVAECGGNPGRVLASIENTGSESIKKEAFAVICAILNKDIMPIFSFSEKMGKSKENSAEVVDYLIDAFESLFRVQTGGAAFGSNPSWMNQVLPHLAPGQAKTALDALFALSKNLQYNVNLRLQWESTLLKLLGE